MASPIPPGSFFPQFPLALRGKRVTVNTCSKCVPTRSFSPPLFFSASRPPSRPRSRAATKTITILIYDGKTGRPLIPDNYVIRIDHLDAVHNEWLTLKDDGTGIVAVPSGAPFLGVQGAYHKS